MHARLNVNRTICREIGTTAASGSTADSVFLNIYRLEIIIDFAIQLSKHLPNFEPSPLIIDNCFKALQRDLASRVPAQETVAD